MKKYQTSLVVICIGTNDTQSIKLDNYYIPFRSKKWIKLYKERIKEIINIVRSFDSEIVWLLPPIMGRKKIVTKVYYIKNIIQDVCDECNVLCIDLWSILADKYGQFQYSTVSSYGNQIALRAKDGIHITPMGNQILAKYVILQLKMRFNFLETSERRF